MTDTIAPKPTVDDDRWRKFWLKSKTAVFAVGTAIAGLGDVVKPYTDDLREALGKHWFTAVMVGIGAVTLWLRSKTAGGLSVRKQ